MVRVTLSVTRLTHAGGYTCAALRRCDRSDSPQPDLIVLCLDACNPYEQPACACVRLRPDGVDPPPH